MIGLQAYAIILPSVLYNLVIGLSLCIAFHNYFRVIWTELGINAVREVTWWLCMLTTSYSSYSWCEWSSVQGHSILKFAGAVRRRLILLWRRRLLPVATRCRSVSADYCFACYLSFYFVYVFFKRKFETLNSLFLTARLTHQKENHKLPGRVTVFLCRNTRK